MYGAKKCNLLAKALVFDADYTNQWAQNEPKHIPRHKLELKESKRGRKQLHFFPRKISGRQSAGDTATCGKLFLPNKIRNKMWTGERNNFLVVTGRLYRIRSISRRAKIRIFSRPSAVSSGPRRGNRAR